VSWLNLDPESTLARIQSSGQIARPLTFGESLCLGGLGFCVVSVGGFGPWVFAGRWLGQRIGELGMYLACLAAFLLLSGLILHRLIIGPGSLRRFYQLFSAAFFAYALIWCLAWFLTRKTLGRSAEWLGAAAGMAAFGWIMAKAFNLHAGLGKVIAALFIGNAAGYFAGGILYAWAGSPAAVDLLGGVLDKAARGMLGGALWGVAYGLGMGLGLGYAFHECQREIRERLKAKGG
jgi:hypothetical protein